MERTSRRDARARVVGVLAEAGAVSRADLARRAALAPSTVSAVVSDLQAAGLVVEPAEPVHPPERGTHRPPAGADRAAPQGGRGRRDRLRQAPSADRDLRPLARAAGRAPPRARRRSARRGSDRAGQAGRSTTRSTRPGRQRPRCVGVGHGAARPGAPAVGRARATRRSCPAGSAYARRGGGRRGARLPVEVENDANLGALGEWMWGAGRGADAHGLRQGRDRYRSRVHRRRRAVRRRGRHGGRARPHRRRPGGPICRCGNRGCLETLAGAPAVLSSLRESTARGYAAATRSRWRSRGDAGCQRAIADAGTRDRHRRRPRSATSSIRSGSSSAATSARRASCCSTPLRESLRRGAIRSAAEDVTVVQGELGDRAEVLGAVALVLSTGRRSHIA